MKFQEFMQKSLLMGLYQSYHQNFSPLVKNLKREDVNLHDSLVLLALFFEGSDSITPSDLEFTLALPKDQISQAIRRLKNKDLITSRINLNDSRKRQLSITRQGRKKASRLISIFDFQENSLEESHLKEL